MATFSEALRSGIKSAFCQVISTTDRATALIRRKVTGDLLDDVSFPALINRWVCDRPSPSTAPPPFTGGQCPVSYNVTGTCSAANSATWDCGQAVTWTGSISGPGISIEVVSSQARLTNSAGQNAPCVMQGSSSQGIFVVPDCVPRGAGNPFAFEGSVSIVSVVRSDGLPDNCGDQTPEIGDLPAGWNQAGGDITYVNNEGNNVTVPVVAAFGYASLNVDADITVPVTVDVGGINFEVDFNLNTGDIQLFPTNNDYGDRRRGTKPTDVVPPEGDTPDYPSGLPPQLPGIDGGEPEREAAIVAVVVTVTEFDNGLVGTLFQSDNPDISIPNFGYISFLCRVGTIDSAWTSDIPVKNRRNVIPCPLPWGAIQVKGTPRQGVSWVLTPLYSKKEAPIAFPA